MRGRGCRLCCDDCGLQRQLLSVVHWGVSGVYMQVIESTDTVSEQHPHLAGVCVECRRQWQCPPGIMPTKGSCCVSPPPPAIFLLSKATCCRGGPARCPHTQTPFHLASGCVRCKLDAGISWPGGAQVRCRYKSLRMPTQTEPTDVHGSQLT